MAEVSFDRTRPKLLALEANSRHLSRLTSLVSELLVVGDHKEKEEEEEALNRDDRVIQSSYFAISNGIKKEDGLLSMTSSPQIIHNESRRVLSSQSTEMMKKEVELRVREEAVKQREQRMSEQSARLEQHRLKLMEDRQMFHNEMSKQRQSLDERHSDLMRQQERMMEHTHITEQRLTEERKQLNQMDLEIQLLHATLQSEMARLLDIGQFVEHNTSEIKEESDMSRKLKDLSSILRQSVIEFNQSLFQCTSQLKSANASTGSASVLRVSGVVSHSDDPGFNTPTALHSRSAHSPSYY